MFSALLGLPRIRLSASFWHGWHTFLCTCTCVLCTGRCRSLATMCTGLACYDVLQLSSSFTYRCTFKWAGDSAVFLMAGIPVCCKGDVAFALGQAFSRQNVLPVLFRLWADVFLESAPFLVNRTHEVNRAWQSHVGDSAGLGIPN